MKCDICGYENEDKMVVFERSDGIVRCTVCVRRSLAPELPYVSEDMEDRLYFDEGRRYPWECEFGWQQPGELCK